MPLPPLGVEQVSAELRRVIEELHRQAERRDEEYERARQALREDTERLRDELRRVQDEHAKEVRDLERQLSKVKEEASEKRFELRERLLDAQTDARLAEGGVEASWLDRLVDRHGEDLAGLVAGVASAFANRPVWDGNAQADETDGGYDALPNPAQPAASALSPPGPPFQPPAAPGTVQAEAQSEMVEHVARLLTEGEPEAIEDLVVALRSELDGSEALRLAGSVMQALLDADPSQIGARIGPVVASQYPVALTFPPATVVQLVRAYGIAEAEREANWLLSLVRGFQAPAASAGEGETPEPATDAPSATPTSEPS